MQAKRGAEGRKFSSYINCLTIYSTKDIEVIGIASIKLCIFKGVWNNWFLQWRISCFTQVSFVLLRFTFINEKNLNFCPLQRLCFWFIRSLFSLFTFTFQVSLFPFHNRLSGEGFFTIDSCAKPTIKIITFQYQMRLY